LQKGDKWGNIVLGAGLGGASTHFAVISKHVLKQTFRPKYAKKQCTMFGKKLEERSPGAYRSWGQSAHFVVI